MVKGALSTSQTEDLQGIIEKVTYHNPDNGFCVLRVKVKGQRDLVTVVGSSPVITAGEWIQTTGSWFQDKVHGLQFKTILLKTTPPNTLDGILKYLGSGMIKGVGPVYAKNLVNAFGEEVFDIIEQNPERLSEVPGIGPHRRHKIITGWADQKAIRTIMLFLHSYGVSTTRAVRIYKTYGNAAVQIIKGNPYQLARDIRGIGFIIADTIAMQIGIAQDSLIRARAGLNHTLATAMDEGHCCLPVPNLLESAQTLLEINGDILETALDLELQEGTLIQDFIRDTSCVFLSGLYQAEKGIAEKLHKLQSTPAPWLNIDIPNVISWVEEKNSITLSQSQKQALNKALTHKVTIVTGGPGVGKTTLLRSILQILHAQKMELALCAPTGRAAKRMTEATGFEAKTIHRLLNIIPETGFFAHNNNTPLVCDVVVIDEVSMVDVSLMNALLKAIPDQAALILVGDQDQLPSVGPGQILADLIASGAIPFIHLAETFRQAASSKIISVAQSINKGVIPPLKGYGADSDFFFIECEEPEKALTTIVELVQRRLPSKLGYSPLNDIQVLCPMTRGMVGTRSLNIELQKALNPPSEKSLQKFGSWYSVGDKVMQIENNYQKEVYNGDIGIIQQINEEGGEVLIDFEGKKVAYDMHELDEIILAYAMTIHKSQGSEYPVVIIPLLTQHYPMLKKNLVYTGITRGKKLVILVGQKKALAISVNNKNVQKRWSMLEGHLKALS
ncbi:ATP-dependent RecD-like DNA helicase [Candidatus Paracaedibacter symbiosus]|uniref:SF1B family DNA helicase RecD2 n=1 Tax=Candidatus Paracaedibacter symbiosus TaxID=244582 RepID=UPI000509C03F|nr:ATP-dependent RecD-like DNA helicase [Candidatus Paracaedibacter symbiosus]